MFDADAAVGLARRRVTARHPRLRHRRPCWSKVVAGLRSPRRSTSPRNTGDTTACSADISAGWTARKRRPFPSRGHRSPSNRCTGSLGSLRRSRVVIPWGDRRIRFPLLRMRRRPGCYRSSFRLRLACFRLRLACFHLLIPRPLWFGARRCRRGWSTASTPPRARNLRIRQARASHARSVHPHPPGA